MNFIIILKIYCSQVNVDFEKNQCSTQRCLLVLIEKFQEPIDTGNKFGALLSNLLKAFDCLDY